MKMLIAGDWIDTDEKIDVTNPFDNSVIDTVPSGTTDHVETAYGYAKAGAKKVEKTSGYERYEFLMRAAELMAQRKEDLAQTITKEEGKPIGEGRGEVERSRQTLICSAEEAKRLDSEVVPLDGAPGSGNRFGFTIRVPCGVVLAISPFNFPLNLVCHKVGPALAGGNSVVVKPAGDTPLVCLKLAEILLEAGCPPEALQVITGPGGTLGDALVSDPRPRKVTFTGSVPVGKRIMANAGLKKVTMELGSNSPFVILPDADLEKAAVAIATTGYANAGQVCISAQRIIAEESIYADLIDAVKAAVGRLDTGNPLDEGTNVGPLVRQKDAERVEEWIREAADQGARIVLGGERSGAVYAPTVVADVKPDMRLSREELFGPAVAMTPAADVDQAIEFCNDSDFGLSAAIFTESLENAMKFARNAESGNVHINWGPQWRADLMPYGGFKDSGFGKEGPKYAIEEMTELKMVVMHLRG